MARKKKDSEALDDFLSRWDNVVLNVGQLRKATGPPISTGSIGLDRLMGGGLHRGYLSEFYGPSGGGKSTIALAAASNVLNNGGSVLWEDIEGSLDFGDSGSARTSWLHKNGIDPDNSRFKVAWPRTGEEAYSLALDAVVSQIFDLVILDSVAAMVTEAELDARETKGTLTSTRYGGGLATLNSGALKHLVDENKRVRKAHVILVNQQREKIGVHIGGKKSTGGRIVEHMIRTRLWVCRLHFPKLVTGSDELLSHSKVVLEKSAFANPGSFQITISSNHGLDLMQEVIDFAVAAGHIREQRGGRFQMLDGDEVIGTAHGMGKLRTWLRSNNDYYARIMELARAAGGSEIRHDHVDEDADSEA